LGTLETQYVTFELNGLPYGANVREVSGVIRMVGMSEAPDTLPFVAGLINLRGRIIPVLDMRAALNLPAVPYTLATPVLVTETDNFSVGLIVDRVLDVIDVPNDSIKRPEDLCPTSRYISGLIKTGAGLLFLLDLPALREAL
jgi:purine-binding chemotaxis protein CheW